MTRIVFENLKVGALASCSSVNTGTNRLVGRRNVSLVNESLGNAEGDRNAIRYNWFGIKGKQTENRAYGREDDSWGRPV